MAESKPLQLIEHETDRREYSVDSLCKDLEEIPCNMRLFSLSMRSLYGVNAVSSRSPNAAKMNKLRDNMKADALVYIKGLLPVSTKLVESLNDFFEYFIDYNYDQWLKELNHILDDVTGYIQCCTAVVQMHETIMGSLKMKEDEAKMMLKELELVSAEYLRTKKELDFIIPLQFAGALCLCLLDPQLFAKAAPSIMSNCATTIATSAAKGSQALINESATLIIGETIIPSLSKFIGSLRAIAGFFSVVEKQLSSFKRQGKNVDSRDYYDRMRSKAAKIISNCSQFYAMTPDVKSDFLALPETLDDTNYVEKWLEKAKKEIEIEYKNEIPSAVEDMISKFQTRLQICD